MNLEQQQHVADIGAAVSTGSAGAAVLGFMGEMNEILIFVATIIAIVSGTISLYEKWKLAKARKERRNDR